MISIILYNQTLKKLFLKTFNYPLVSVLRSNIIQTRWVSIKCKYSIIWSHKTFKGQNIVLRWTKKYTLNFTLSNIHYVHIYIKQDFQAWCRENYWIKYSELPVTYFECVGALLCGRLHECAAHFLHFLRQCLELSVNVVCLGSSGKPFLYFEKEKVPESKNFGDSRQNNVNQILIWTAGNHLQK